MGWIIFLLPISSIESLLSEAFFIWELSHSLSSSLSLTSIGLTYKHSMPLFGQKEATMHQPKGSHHALMYGGFLLAK